MKAFFSCLICLTVFSACTTVSSVSTSQIPPIADRKQKIHSSASSLVILSIPFGNSFPDQARAELESQCPHGRIDGILSKQQSTSYFLVATQELVLEGYCLAAAPPSRAPSPASAPAATPKKKGKTT